MGNTESKKEPEKKTETTTNNKPSWAPRKEEHTIISDPKPREDRFRKLEDIHPDVHCLEVFKLKDFENIIQQLISEQKLKRAPNFYDLLKYLVDNKVWLLEHLPSRKSVREELFKPSYAKVGSSDGWISISYWWSYKLKDFFEALQNPPQVAPKITEEDYIWLDIVCIKQFDNNVGLNLRYLEPLYVNAKYHMIVGGQSFYRGWVQFEFCLSQRKVGKERYLYPLDREVRGNIENVMVEVSYARKMERLMDQIDNEGSPVQEFDIDKGLSNVLSSVDRSLAHEGFAAAKFSFETDRAFVEAMIKELFGSLEDYNQALRKSFGELKMTYEYDKINPSKHSRTHRISDEDDD